MKLKDDRMHGFGGLIVGLLLVVGMAIPQLGWAEGERDWGFALGLYRDSRAQAVGDILTVIVVESAEAAKDAGSTETRNTTLGGSINFGHPRFDNRGTSWTNGTLPAYSLDTSRSFSGQGSIENKDEFTTTMSVTVRDVLPNGNLVIEGQRSVVIRNETVDMVLTGVVRQQDVTRNNTIQSTQIADASVHYKANGALARSQERGLITRIVNFVNPF